MKTLYDELNLLSEEMTDGVSALSYVVLNCAR